MSDDTWGTDATRMGESRSGPEKSNPVLTI